MHFVLRGPEPTGLRPIRQRYTQAWIYFYRNGIGNKPTDSRWRGFINQLSTRFGECCGYCEIGCSGVVDHYRPKNKFPHLVYEWHNWVFSCHDCNKNKSSHWPPSGFLDPCSIGTFSHKLQCCFTFDWMTGEVLPHPNLSQANHKRARVTITLLRLNLPFRLKARLDHIDRLDTLLKLAEYNPKEASKKLAFLILPNASFCSLTKCYLAEHLP